MIILYRFATELYTPPRSLSSLSPPNYRSHRDPRRGCPSILHCKLNDYNRLNIWKSSNIPSWLKITLHKWIVLVQLIKDKRMHLKWDRERESGINNTMLSIIRLLYKKKISLYFFKFFDKNHNTRFSRINEIRWKIRKSRSIRQASENLITNIIINKLTYFENTSLAPLESETRFLDLINLYIFSFYHEAASHTCSTTIKFFEYFREIIRGRKRARERENSCPEYRQVRDDSKGRKFSPLGCHFRYTRSRLGCAAAQ